MSKHAKLLLKMRANPKDWLIADLKVVAEHYGFTYRQPGTSHVTFSNGKLRVTVPARKPIKQVYVTKFIQMIDLSLQKVNKNDYN